MVECEMRNTLAHLLDQSLLIFSKFDMNSVESQEYMAWLDQFPVNITFSIYVNVITYVVRNFWNIKLVITFIARFLGTNN